MFNLLTDFSLFEFKFGLDEYLNLYVYEQKKGMTE